MESSQRVADVVFRALSKIMPDKVPAAGSGTMMNVMMGGSHDGDLWTYYETVGGGTGGRPSANGVSGVHVNMTNTLNTPIEVAERLYPLTFTKYTIRNGSGGSGKYRGGDGIVRAFVVKSDTRLSILADRFITKPWGINEGQDGMRGKVTIKRSDGNTEVVPSKWIVKLFAGDQVIIETPGGGGWGGISTE